MFLALGVAVYALGSSVYDGTALRVVAGALAAAGLFSLFEANRSWCAVRALGFKTKL